MIPFARIASQDAATKRATLSGAGVRSGYSVFLTGLKCLPLMPVDAETRNRPELQTFHEVKETYLESGLDIDEGDMLVIDGVDYPVRAVEDWPWRGGETYLRLIVEQLKR